MNSFLSKRLHYTRAKVSHPQRWQPTLAGVSIRLASQKRLADLPLSEAVSFLASLDEMDVLYVKNPISRLQRQFRLGYRSASLLASLLEQSGHWQRAIDTDGTHFALLRLKPFA